ncbi:SET domain-containing protein [Plenodomus tracheiphilus IPT5]|uniref:SET domain-containing protein n=1 Tax=Plenodomus tracheiphilus IPT5 TaxID=1408161 RepID=A0A6A7B587_9PLEO|nr:SET domain-containing protein [Plenodomus tracheiphilus IPT5]
MAGQENDSSSLVRNLLLWFTQNGGWLSPDVQVVYDETHGFHMLAKGPLTSPVVVSCPLRLTLSILNLDADTNQVTPVNSSLQQCRGRIPDHILTYLLLVEQRNRGEASPWHAYITCLPGSDSMTTPLWFDEDDFAFLVGTSVAPAAQERKQEIHKQWANVVAVFQQLEIPLADNITVESLLWAATIFTSRAFISTHILPEHETVPLLFPVVDILNHAVSARVEWDFQPHQSFALKCLDGGNIAAGQELFNNYAPKQNDELLLGYGFCLEENPIEQFALKLAFPPMLQQYAQEMGLLDARSVPFGMSPSFLEKDPNSEQHFLRTWNHPFGRYENHVPFFRGIPPYIVHFFFIQTVMTSGLDITEIDVERPGSRVTVQVLVLLHQALEQRSRSLPLHIDLEPKNMKQKFAKIYRDGQAKIIHSIREELKAAIDRLRIPGKHSLPVIPILLSVTDGLTSMKAFFPAGAEEFQKGLQKHNLHDPQDGKMIWTLLLITTIASWLSTENSEEPVPPKWFSDVLKVPLPALEDGIEDAETYTFIDENFDDFLHYPGSGPEDSAMEKLDDLGLACKTQGTDMGFIRGPTENLGARLIMWGMKIAEQDVVPVFEDGDMKKCLFVMPRGSGGAAVGGEWMYEDVVVGTA